MSKKQEIAQLLIESSELLNENPTAILKGIGTTVKSIYGAFLQMYPKRTKIATAAISIYALIKAYKSIRKTVKKANDHKNKYCMMPTNIFTDKELSEIKFVKYRKGSGKIYADAINKSYNLLKTKKKLFDKTIEDINSVKTYKDVTESLLNKWDNLFTRIFSDIDDVYKKIDKINKEASEKIKKLSIETDLEGFKEEYKLISNARASIDSLDMYINTAGDDAWEGIPFMTRAYGQDWYGGPITDYDNLDRDEQNKINNIYNKLLDILCYSNDYNIDDYDIENIDLQMYVQFLGKEPKDSKTK